MKYLLKKEASEMIRSKVRNKYISEQVGLSMCYVSLIVNRHRPIPKRLAYTFTKVIGLNYEIEDLFEPVG